MKINITNKAKVEEELNKVQAKSKVRTISAEDIIRASIWIEKILENHHIPQKEFVGFAFKIDLHAQKFPNAYKFTPESTHVYIERTTTGWFMTNVCRGRCGSPNKRYSMMPNCTARFRELVVKHLPTDFAF